MSTLMESLQGKDVAKVTIEINTNNEDKDVSSDLIDAASANIEDSTKEVDKSGGGSKKAIDFGKLSISDIFELEISEVTPKKALKEIRKKITAFRGKYSDDNIDNLKPHTGASAKELLIIIAQEIESIKEDIRSKNDYNNFFNGEIFNIEREVARAVATNTTILRSLVQENYGI